MQVLAEAPGNGSRTWLRDALSTARSPRLRRLARAITVGLAVHEVGKRGWEWGRSRAVYTVAVPATDKAYEAVAGWMTSQVPPSKQRALIVSTTRVPRSDGAVLVEAASENEKPKLPQMTARYDGSRAQTVRIGGHRVTVGIDRESQMGEGITLTVNSDSDWYRPLERVVFTCYGEDARDAVLDLLATLVAEQAEVVKPVMQIATRWGHWRTMRDAPFRSLDTVVLPAGRRESLVADLDRFYASEGLYARVGLPWHRGLLFHGPPGCGKTSTATALASHFGLDVFLLPLSDLEADVNLMALLGEVPPRSLLVIEDIDVVHAAKERDDSETKGLTMSGLLNALDGIATPHGLVTVLTTNDIEALDPALTRAGRADVTIEFGYLDDEQTRDIARLITGLEPDTSYQAWPWLDGTEVSHCDLLEAAKPHLDDPKEALDQMASLLTRRRCERTP